MSFHYKPEFKQLICFFTFLLLTSAMGQSRQPAYFILGEDQFKGARIYDVIQDQDLNYWFSTNEGLFFYDHYRYRKIECNASKSISFFNFVINGNGTIFCNNLNNQVFAIKNQTCSLLYELKPDEIQPDLSLAVTPENHILIGGRKLILAAENGSVTARYDLTGNYVGVPFTTRDQRILYPLSQKDSVAVCQNGKFEKRKLIYTNTPPKTKKVLQFFRFGDTAYAINMESKDLFLFNEADYTLTAIETYDVLKRSESLRLYATSANLWAAGTLPGVASFDKTLSEKTAGLFYTDVFVSDIYEDNEQNILISTFDHGVYVIPDLKIPDLIKDFLDEPVGVITQNDSLGLILGTSRGKLVTFKNGKFDIIHENGKRSIEVIIDNNKAPFLIFDDGSIRALDKKNGRVYGIIQASLKDGVFVNPTTFYLSTNNGLMRGERKNSGNFETTWVPGLHFRNYAVEKEDSANTLYVATINGLFVLDSLDHVTELKHDNQSIFSSTLCSDGHFIYAPLTKPGILILEHGQVIRKIEPEIDGKPVLVFKMRVHKKSIFAHSEAGVCQFDMNGKMIRSFTNSGGQANRRILDFTLEEDKLWISTPNGLQSIDLNYTGNPVPVPLVKIIHIYANDSEVQAGAQNEFDSDTRKFKFFVSSPTLRYKSSIRYHYQLKGYDTGWLVNDYFSNEILYNALAPGAYEFKVKAENQGKFSETVSYKFSISAPFYITWWFISLLVFSFLSIVLLVYKKQLNRQRIKAQQINELNASKLTAIQSQMNPHFIFNSLNSIQDLILKGDVENSYSYITTFSNLVRRTLNYSDKDFIDFEQELKLLELYLSLEKLRFKKDFNYVIETNGIVDIQIPPMLIQPFIENALVHGLLHKEGEKRLKISFRLNDHLICIIEDNGIGRNKARSIKERQRTDHESFSGQAIRKRFEILSSHFQGELGYTYEDLEENAKPSGTRVILQIPVRYKY
ncbi:MAG: histidine kinase [Bacteroidetes bacterium]|nr:histidine kinase [Bacteroidota bacterium]